jgi:DNA-binding NarL/FixJ family response regulator
MSKTRVLIVDSQPIFRAGVRRALAHECGLEKLEILDCAQGNEGQEALRQIEENSPDVVLLEVGGPFSDGLALSTSITRSFPATKVVALSADHNADELFDVIKTGAAAYLSKDSSIEDLTEALRRAEMGEYPINDGLVSRPKVASLVLDQFENMASDSGPEDVREKVVTPLTAREDQFLSLIAEDNSNRQIAEILGISEQEVKECVSVILRKLNASDRAHEVMKSLCNDWLSLQDGERLPRTTGLPVAQTAVVEAPRAAKQKGNGKGKTKRRTPSKK